MDRRGFFGRLAASVVAAKLGRSAPGDAPVTLAPPKTLLWVSSGVMNPDAVRDRFLTLDPEED